LSAYADPVSLAIQGQRMKQPRFPRDMKLAIVEATARHAQRQHEARKGSIDEDVIGLLRTALKSKDELVQLAALQALEATNTGGHLRDLEKLAGTRDPSLRRAVFAALTKHHKTEEHWLKKMLSYANSPDVDKRCAAVQPLSQILGARAIEALTGMVSDKHHRVRRLLFPVLTLLRDPASVAPLIAQLEQEESRLRGSLRRTLMRITGEDHGSSFQRWSAWYASQSKPYVPPSLKTVVELERKRAHRRGAQVTEASFYGIEVESDRAAWVLDISGSMAAETRDGSTRLEEMKHQVGAALEALADGDLFNLVLFSGGVSSWQDELIPMSRRARREATDFLREIQARGATAIFDALEAAIEDPRLDTVYLLSDGDATAGTLVDPASVRAAVREWARRRSLTIHCIAVGADHPLLRGLAEDTGGQYRRVD
jgi:HEAT repeat protein